jgi:flagellar basal body-associated protein FliL
MALTIITVTVYSFISKSLAKGKPVYTVPAKEMTETLQPVDSNIFTGIGRIRTITADKEPKTVIVSIAFPYDKADVPFMEELASKIADFRSITFSFFNNFSADDLRKQSYESIKTALLNRYNTALQLGQIQALYFNDFMIVD